MCYFRNQRGTLNIKGTPFPIHMKEGNKMNNFLMSTIQTKTVLRKIDTGYALQKETSEALLQHNETEDELQTDQEVDVCLYQDKNGQTIATPKLPHVQMDGYGWAQVVEVIPALAAV